MVGGGRFCGATGWFGLGFGLGFGAFGTCDQNPNILDLLFNILFSNDNIVSSYFLISIIRFLCVFAFNTISLHNFFNLLSFFFF